MPLCIQDLSLYLCSVNGEVRATTEAFSRAQKLLDHECFVWKCKIKIQQWKRKHSLVNILRVDGTKSEVMFCVFGSQVTGRWSGRGEGGVGCYMWSPSLWEGGGGGGGGSCSSSSLCCVAGVSASMKESVEWVLMRSGARRRRLLGVHGSLTWALCEGATMLLSSSASASHGGICIGAMGSRSGMKAGFSIPAEGKKETQLVFTGFLKVKDKKTRRWIHLTSCSVGDPHGEWTTCCVIARGAVPLWELKI